MAAAKLQIPVAHVEAGLRSFNRRMPEEINRVLTDRVSDLLFCPTETAVRNLAAEGTTRGVDQVGDVMYDLALFYGRCAQERYDLAQWGVEQDGYTLCTLHREENTHDPTRLRAILSALRTIAAKTSLLLPLHPGTAKRIESMGETEALAGIHVLEPLSYLAMTRLEASAELILTDSGWVRKEVFPWRSLRYAVR